MLDNLGRKASNINFDIAYPTTFFSNLEATTKAERQLTFAQLSAELSRASASTKFGLPLFRLSRFGDTPNETGCLRYNENMIAYTGAMGDYDAEKMPIDIAHENANRLVSKRSFTRLHAIRQRRRDGESSRRMLSRSSSIPQTRRPPPKSILNILISSTGYWAGYWLVKAGIGRWLSIMATSIPNRTTTNSSWSTDKRSTQSRGYRAKGNRSARRR